jgi:hypothetical protein
MQNLVITNCFIFFPSVDVTDDSTAIAKTLIGCSATIDFALWASLTRHKIYASSTGKELVILFFNGSQKI